MFDQLPDVLRKPLWRAKHAACCWGQKRGLLEYLQGLLGSQLERLSVDTVIDVGANDGQYARAVRRVGFQGAIWSFEPIPSLAAKLREQALRDGNWRVFEQALGETAESKTFHISEESTFSSLLASSDFARTAYPLSREAESLEIQVDRLDSIPQVVDALQAQKSRVHLKIDTQGTDLAVFRGASGILPQVVSLQFELGVLPLYEKHQSYWHSLEKIETMGFALSGVFPVSRDRLGRVVDADCLFVRA